MTPKLVSQISKITYVKLALRPIWEYYGRKAECELRSDDWQNYSDLVDLLQKADPAVVEAWPNNDLRDENGQPAITFVRIKPNGLKLLKEQPQRVHRQVTINGEKPDIRNDVNHEILLSRIRDLAEVTIPSWIKNCKHDPNPKVRHASQLRLQKAVMLRGNDLETNYPQVWKDVKEALLADADPS